MASEHLTWVGCQTDDDHIVVGCSACPWTADLGFDPSVEDTQAALGFHRADPAALVLTPLSACSASIVPDDKGGMVVKLHVPTYGGGATFALYAERSGGDWIVHIPWAPGVDDQGKGLLPTGDPSEVGYDVANGIVHLGAPDVPVLANYNQIGG